MADNEELPEDAPDGPIATVYQVVREARDFLVPSGLSFRTTLLILTIAVSLVLAPTYGTPCVIIGLIALFLAAV